jgi:hypothetical protein
MEEPAGARSGHYGPFLSLRRGTRSASRTAMICERPMTYLAVECLRCGGQRQVPATSTGRGDAGECPRCHYLGWAPSESLDESIRRRIREQSPEIRARIKLVA